MIRIHLLLSLIAFLPVLLSAQNYINTVEHRPIFWLEQEFIYKTPGKWSFELDHQYRRQAADVDGRDLNIFRLPLQQVFRPWIGYQLSKPVKLSLSPVGLWWQWQSPTEDQPTAFFQEIRIIPQVTISQDAGQGKLSYRIRTELRWPSRTDTLRNEYIFLSDGESRQVLTDRFNVRLRCRVNGYRPLARSDWYVQGNIEPMAVVSESGVRFDQNRTTVSLGRHLGNSMKLELGCLNQFSIDTDRTERIRTFKLNHALQVYFSLEVGRQSTDKKDGDSRN